MSPFCTQCGFPLKPSAKFCSECGTKVSHTPADGPSFRWRTILVAAIPLTIVFGLAAFVFLVNTFNKKGEERTGSPPPSVAKTKEIQTGTPQKLTEENPSETTSKKETPSRDHFTAEAAWNPPNIVWGRMQDECRGAAGEEKFVECVHFIMREAEAPSQAIAFTKLLGGAGYMDSFQETGSVDVAGVFYPFRANDNNEVVLVNGIPKIVDPNDFQLLKKVDIRRDPLYLSLVKQFPKLELWAHAEFETTQRLPSGGQRYVFKIVLLNGCHACEVAGYAHIAFDFDSTKQFLGPTLLYLSREEPVARPSPEETKKRETPKRVPTNEKNEESPHLPLLATLEGSFFVDFSLNGRAISGFSPDGRLVATSKLQENSKYTTWLWETASGRLVLSLDREFKSFSSDGRFILTSYSTKDWKYVTELWETTSRRVLRSWNDSFNVSPNAQLLAATTWSEGKQTTRVYKATESEDVRSVEGSFLTFSENGQLLVTETWNANGSTVIRWWDATSGRLTGQAAGKLLDVSPTGRLIAIKGEKAFAEIRETATGRLLYSIASWGRGGSFSLDEQFIVTEVFDPKVNRNAAISKVWDAKTGRELASIDGEFSRNSFSPQRGLIAVSRTNKTSDEVTTQIWSIRSMKPLVSLDGSFHGFSPDGKLLLTGFSLGSRDGALTKIWESETGRLVSRVEGYPFSFSPDGRLVLTGTEGSTKVWRVE